LFSPGVYDYRDLKMGMALCALRAASL
jgi:hypothetical protein